MQWEGKSIGPYRLIGVLGSGGMGTVFRAYDERLEREVAVKVVRHDRLGRSIDEERLRREARALARVSHPFLVQIYDVTEWEDGQALVMELVEGESLADRLAEDGPLPIDQAVLLLSECLQGLAALHDRNILHLDLKSANIMITHGHAKIMDFGLARVLEATSSDENVAGTPGYVAPERWRGEPPSIVSDLFSLGVVIYEMLTGRLPFAPPGEKAHRETFAEPAVSVEKHRPEIPTPLAGLLDQLLEVDPSDRPASASRALESLRRMNLQLFSVSSGALVDGSPSPERQRRRSASEKYTDSWDRGTAASVDATGSLVLAPSPGSLTWNDLARNLRFAYYRFRPVAAYRRHARLVDRSFQETLTPDQERELRRLEAFLDRHEAPHWHEIRSRLVSVRDDLLSSRSAGD